MRLQAISLAGVSRGLPYLDCWLYTTLVICSLAKLNNQEQHGTGFLYLIIKHVIANLFSVRYSVGLILMHRLELFLNHLQFQLPCVKGQ